MGKGAYGTVEFWDEYYVVDRPNPYDWWVMCPITARNPSHGLPRMS